ncbi:MAG TPA: hypothetical protein VMR21_04565 [Vicinamibacteria bacterium]|nr:hypothetical protein [Vicinamibacteria bacterium]
MVSAVLAGLLVFQPTPPSASPSPSSAPRPVVRVSVDVVQVDAVVTDGEGRHVTDLTAEDFILKERGQVREISHVSYVAVGPSPPSPPTVSGPVASPVPAPSCTWTAAS